jgi:Domain of unknown function (DUF3291)
MWWVATGHCPSVEEAVACLEYLKQHGSSDHAFDWATASAQLWKTARCSAWKPPPRSNIRASLDVIVNGRRRDAAPARADQSSRQIDRARPLIPKCGN